MGEVRRLADQVGLLETSVQQITDRTTAQMSALQISVTQSNESVGNKMGQVVQAMQQIIAQVTPLAPLLGRVQALEQRSEGLTQEGQQVKEGLSNAQKYNSTG